MKIKTIITVLCFFQINILSAQIATRQWDARFGGGKDDYLRDLHLTTDGGYIPGGYSLSPISGDKTQ